MEFVKTLYPTALSSYAVAVVLSLEFYSMSK